MLAVGPRDNESVRSDGGSEPIMTQSGLGYSDVGERRVAEHDVERPARPRIQVSDDVRRDHLGPCAEIGRGEISTERVHSLGAALYEGRARGSARQRLDPKRPRPSEEVEDS